MTDSPPKRTYAVLALAAGLAITVWAVVGSILAAGDTTLSAAEATLLGIVEGLTEYLPVSSTGHLTVLQDLLGLGQDEQGKIAADAYAIVIQAGAILAVLAIYRERVASIIQGALGRDEDGRRLLGALILGFIPAAIVGLAAGDTVKANLFGIKPVAAAWIVGGVAILILHRRLTSGDGRPFAALTPRDGLLIGLAQILALWPGTSRSLVTIFAALAIGLSLAAAVEFSFILGLATLGAATAYEALTEGSVIAEEFGLTSTAIGFVAATVAAFISVRWMVEYLQRHSLAVFGWYRIGLGILAVVLLATGVI